MNAVVVLFANAGLSIKCRFAPNSFILLPAMSTTSSAPAKSRDVRLWLLASDPFKSDYTHRHEGLGVTDLSGFLAMWTSKTNFGCKELVVTFAGSYYVPDGTCGYSCVDPESDNVADVVNAAIRAAIARCPDDAPYALVFVYMPPITPSIVAQRTRITADWRASFAKPKPEPSVIQAYIAATKAVEAAKAAVVCAAERAQSEAKQVTTKGQPLSFDISPVYLDMLCAALEHPSRVYRATPRRADMLRRLGIEVEVVYQVPERIAYLAQAPNSRDTETDGDLYIRMRVPA